MGLNGSADESEKSGGKPFAAAAERGTRGSGAECVDGPRGLFPLLLLLPWPRAPPGPLGPPGAFRADDAGRGCLCACCFELPPLPDEGPGGWARNEPLEIDRLRLECAGPGPRGSGSLKACEESALEAEEMPSSSFEAPGPGMDGGLSMG